MTKTELVDKCNHISSVTNILPEDEEHRLMINVTRGYLPIYHDVACYRPGADVIITDFPLRWTVKDFSRFYKNDGVDVKIVRQKSIPSSICEINKIKNRSRLHFAYANLEVRHLNWVWPLLTDPDGYLTENPGANIFLIKNNVLYTPEPRNILRGISRDFIMSLNKIYGLECVEKNLEPFDLYTCDEAFFTGTPFCIMPIRSADNHVINKTCGYGYYTQRLIKRWIDWVDCDFIHQMRRWDGLK
jgi:branched-chain amino acid aminotransferase